MATQTITNGNNSQFVDKMDSLRSMVRSLLHEASLKTQPIKIDPETGIDFYEKVARYEIQLIESALEVTRGRQNQAAKLLNMRASTLSAKMKQLNIKRGF